MAMRKHQCRDNTTKIEPEQKQEQQTEKTPAPKTDCPLDVDFRFEQRQLFIEELEAARWYDE
jgi:hypothetical protein